MIFLFYLSHIFSFILEIMHNYSKNNEIEINENEFFIKHLIEHLPYLILHSLGFMLGIIGSIVIIVFLIKKKELRNSTNIIIANITITYFILSSIIDSLTVLGKLIIFIIK
jgi:hypothetical protein